MKFGGTSVADAERIKGAARRIVERREAGRRVVAVLSARGKTTDELIAMAEEVSERPDPREMDMLLSTGERISCALCAMAINDLGHRAISLTGSQAGIVTDESHTKALILDVRAVGDHACLRPGERARLHAEIGDRHRQQRHGDPFAGGEQHVKLARGRQRAHLVGQIDELVGGVSHRGDGHHDPVPALARLHDPLRDPLDAIGVGDRRTAVFLHYERHGRAAPPRVVDRRLILSERGWVTCPGHGLVLSSATSRLACATTACSARRAAPPWVPQWLV